MTARDEEILILLCSKVRFFCLEQIARTWWTDKPREVRRARQRMLALAGEGWLKPTTVLARPLLDLSQPIIEWHPGKHAPAFAGVSGELQRRWRLPARKTEVFPASQKAAAIFGGTAVGLVKHLCQATHDLHVSEVFLFYRRNRSDLARLWVGEDSVADDQNASKRPDAILRDHGNVLRVIEFGGSYKPGRLQAVHEQCFKRQHPYEIW